MDKNRTDERFNDVPDILDPDISSRLSDIADNVFAGNSWHIDLYIADDGTGDVEIVSNSSHYGRVFTESKIKKRYTGGELF